ncbi:hypothetical protein SAMN04515692_101347 [Leifsonia sp. CL147]|nr:hypothetical protein SAMN04515694_101132 [Leifsonia sp. CL154]SFL22207.1 hypothetical protein SAMN04515692_101347 [Leifsonia sp. CL147]
MRALRTRAWLLLAATLGVLSLTGCTGLFTDTVTWKGGTFYTRETGINQEARGPMSLTLRADGTGYAVGIPRGNPKAPGSLCTQVLTEMTYSGNVSWRKVTNFQFEIQFPDSHYQLSARPEKFGSGDWAEVRIHACDGKRGFWAMGLSCAQPGLVNKEIPPCRD